MSNWYFRRFPKLENTRTDKIQPLLACANPLPQCAAASNENSPNGPFHPPAPSTSIGEADPSCTKTCLTKPHFDLPTPTHTSSGPAGKSPLCIPLKMQRAVHISTCPAPASVSFFPIPHDLIPTCHHEKINPIMPINFPSHLLPTRTPSP